MFTDINKMIVRGWQNFKITVLSAPVIGPSGALPLVIARTFFEYLKCSSQAKLIVVYPSNVGKTGVRQSVSSTFHMKAVDIMRWRLLFETFKQPPHFDLHRAQAVCRSDVIHQWSLTAHFNTSYELIWSGNEPEEWNLFSVHPEWLIGRG